MATVLRSVRDSAYGDTLRIDHRGWAPPAVKGAGDFAEILRENEAHLRSRKRSRSTQEISMVGPQLDINVDRTTASHLLLWAAASLVAMIFGVIMIVSGAAVAAGYPLAYAAATLVSFGLFAGALAEWRAKRAKM